MRPCAATLSRCRRNCSRCRLNARFCSCSDVGTVTTEKAFRFPATYRSNRTSNSTASVLSVLTPLPRLSSRVGHTT